MYIINNMETLNDSLYIMYGYLQSLESDEEWRERVSNIKAYSCEYDVDENGNVTNYKLGQQICGPVD